MMKAVDAPRVLIVEDDLLVREGVSLALTSLGYAVRSDRDGTSLTETLSDFRPDLALLDVTLPNGPDGFALAEEIRRVHPVPIIFITARDELDDRMRGFDLGADDYVVKPFSPRELAARVRAVLRRTEPSAPTVLRSGDVVQDLTTREVTRAGHPVVLTPTEFELLHALMSAPGT